MEQWIVYIIETKSGKLYTGITKDLEKRFSDHQQRKRGARFFNISSPDRIVYQETYNSRSEATKREIAIKKLTRHQKLELIKKI